MAMFWFKYMKIIKYYLSSSVSNSLPIAGGGGGGGILAVMAYMGRLRLKGVPFHASGI